MGVSWLLFKKSGRQSIGRLSLTVAAIGLGTVILLSFLSGINGLTAQFGRQEWLSIAATQESFQTAESREAQRPIDGVAPLYMGNVPGVVGNATKWRDQHIDTVVLHATGDNSPELPGLKTPKRGEYYVSPGLAKVMREHPEDKVGERFGATYLGVIPDRYVASPDSLTVIRGATDAELAARSTDSDPRVGWKAAAVYSTKPLERKMTSRIDVFSLVIFGFGGTILLFPIVMFVAVATQLGSTQREQRYAALRLIGATRTQVNRVLLLESFVATLVGISVGSGVYLLARGGLEHFTFGGRHFWAEDLTVSWVQYAVFVVLTTMLSLVASWWAMRKVRTSPLGVARREKLGKQPRMWRVLPLLTGVGIFTWLSLPAGSSWLKAQAADSMVPFVVVMGGILLVMFGLVLAGSWLTGWLSSLSARWTKNATVLLASRRISGHSKVIFRSVSGLVLALFAGSFYLAAVSGISTLELESVNNNGYSQLQPKTALISASSPLPEQFESTLKQQSYITAATPVYETAEGETLIPCADVATYTKHHCPSSAAADDLARIDFNQAVVKQVDVVKASADKPEKVSYLVRLAGEEDIDKVRTLALIHGPEFGTLFVADGTRAQKPVISPVVADLAAITYVGIGITLFVAVASLIVSTIGGLFERRRSLFTLRLGGMTISQLKRMVLIESLIPLISTSIVAASAGIWVAVVFLTSFSSTVRVSLSATYFIIVIGALVAAIVGIWLVLPTLKKITAIEQNQTE